MPWAPPLDCLMPASLPQGWDSGAFHWHSLQEPQGWNSGEGVSVVSLSWLELPDQVWKGLD